MLARLRVDTVRHEVMRDSKDVRLTPTESRLLHLLAANANDICTLDQIVAHVWGFGESGDTYLVKAHIRHLREKIEPVPGKPKFIVTSPGVGYMLKRHVVEGSPSAEEAQIHEERQITVASSAPVNPVHGAGHPRICAVETADRASSEYGCEVPHTYFLCVWGTVFIPRAHSGTSHISYSAC